MRKIILLAILAVSFIPMVTHASFDASLRYGAKGKAVTELQEFLAQQKLYSGPITGNFYSMTLKAVTAFQKQEKLPSTGYVGPLTREKMKLYTKEKMNIQESEKPIPPADIPYISFPTNAQIITKTDDQTKILQDQLTKQQAQNDLLKRQIEYQKHTQRKIEESLNKIEQNTRSIPTLNAPPVQPPPSVTLKAFAPNKNGKVLTIKSTEKITIDINIGNPNANNLNPGYTCIKFGDWQGQIVPVDHNESSAQDSNLDFSKLITGGNKTFGVTCSNSAGSKTDSVTIDIEPLPVVAKKVPTDLKVVKSSDFAYSLENLGVFTEILQYSVDYEVYLVDKDGNNYPEFANTIISVNAPDRDRMTAYQLTTLKPPLSASGMDGVTFHYTPRTKGLQTITFFTDSFTKSIVLEVR